MTALCVTFFTIKAHAYEPAPAKGMFVSFPGICLSSTVMTDVTEMIATGNKAAANAKVVDMVNRKICIMFQNETYMMLVEMISEFPKGKSIFQVWRVHAGGVQGFAFLELKQKDAV